MPWRSPIWSLRRSSLRTPPGPERWHDLSGSEKYPAALWLYTRQQSAKDRRLFDVDWFRHHLRDQFRVYHSTFSKFAGRRTCRHDRPRTSHMVELVHRLPARGHPAFRGDTIAHLLSLSAGDQTRRRGHAMGKRRTL